MQVDIEVGGSRKLEHTGIKVEFIGIIGAPTQGRTRRGNTLLRGPRALANPARLCRLMCCTASLPARVPCAAWDVGSSRACGPHAAARCERGLTASAAMHLVRRVLAVRMRRCEVSAF